MRILKTSEKNTPAIAIASSSLFILACIIFFVPISLPHKICIPVGLIALASICICPWQITAALLFSAAGDYFGSCDNLMAQMGCFAIAHIMFIVYFALRYHRKVEHDRKLTARAKGFAVMVIFCAIALLSAVFALIVPSAPAGILRIGVSVYACLICAMLILAMLQRSTLFAVGAILFVFSDFILAWNLFVEDVPHAVLLIMIPYYAAEWLLFIRSSNFRLSKPLRLLRF
jgi:uncharacterized membrane protein YhhN